MPLSAFPSCAGVGVDGRAGGTLTETRRCGLRTFLFVTGNKAPFGVGFEPTYAGYGPAALPLGYPLIAVDAFSPARRVLRPVPKASRLRALAVRAFQRTRHSFRIHTGVEPATSRSETGRSPLELMDSAELLPVSLQSTVCFYESKSYAVLLFVLLSTATLYDPFPGFSWKKSCELSVLGRVRCFFSFFNKVSARTAAPAAPGSGRSCSPARSPSAPARRTGCGSGSPSRLPFCTTA